LTMSIGAPSDGHSVCSTFPSFSSPCTMM